jgi:hypothetical protein
MSCVAGRTVALVSVTLAMFLATVSGMMSGTFLDASDRPLDDDSSLLASERTELFN